MFITIYMKIEKLKGFMCYKIDGNITFHNIISLLVLTESTSSSNGFVKKLKPSLFTMTWLHVRAALNYLIKH